MLGSRSARSSEIVDRQLLKCQGHCRRSVGRMRTTRAREGQRLCWCRQCAPWRRAASTSRSKSRRCWLITLTPRAPPSRARSCPLVMIASGRRLSDIATDLVLSPTTLSVSGAGAGEVAVLFDRCRTSDKRNSFRNQQLGTTYGQQVRRAI